MQWNRRIWLIRFAELLLGCGLVAILIYVLSARDPSTTDDHTQANRRIEMGLSFNAMIRPDGSLRPTAVRSDNGKRLYSWRVSCITNISGAVQGFRYDEPWNSTENRRMEVWGLRSFCDEPSKDAAILAVVGNGAAFSENGSRKLIELPSQVIVLVEVANSGIHWMSPGDFDVANLDHNNSASQRLHPSDWRGIGFHVVFADGQVWRLSSGTPPELLQRFMKINEARKLNREIDLRRFVLETANR